MIQFTLGNSKINKHASNQANQGRVGYGRAYASVFAYAWRMFAGGMPRSEGLSRG